MKNNFLISLKSYDSFIFNLKRKKKLQKKNFKKIKIKNKKLINKKYFLTMCTNKMLFIATSINMQLLNTNILVGYDKVYYNLYINNYYLYINNDKLYVNYFISFENLKKYFLFNSNFIYKQGNIYIFTNVNSKFVGFLKIKNFNSTTKYLNFLSNPKWIKGMISNFNSIKKNKFYFKTKKFPSSFLIINKNLKDSKGIVEEFQKVGLPLNFVLEGNSNLKKLTNLFYVIPGNAKSLSFINYILLINIYLLINVYLLKKKYISFLFNL